MTEVYDGLALDEAHEVTVAPEERSVRSPDRRSLTHRVVLVLCVLAVLGFYARCATSYDKRLTSRAKDGDFQNLQADAFLHGQLDLVREVPPGLAALPDPYDAGANLQFRVAGLHDLSYYNGKLYTYNGPVPVLLLYVPYQWLFDDGLSPTLACLVLCAAGFVASVRAFQHAARRFLGPLSLTMEATAVIALGLAGPMAWIIHIGRGYEVSIAAGYFMVAMGLLFLCRGLFSPTRHPLLDLALASAFFAGSVGARPSLVWAVGFLVFGLAYVRWAASATVSSRLSAAIALVAPALVVAVALAWYNWVRFDRIGEFGTSYMLLGENVRLARANEFGFLQAGVFQYLLSPSRFVRGDFPWFHLRLFSYPVPTEQNYLLEPVAGLLPNLPATLLGVVAYLVAPWRWLRAHLWLTLLILTAAANGLLTLAAISYRQHGATMRYALDFVPPLLFASVLGGVAWLTRLESVRVRRASAAAALLVVGWSVFFVLNITAYPCAGTGSC